MKFQPGDRVRISTKYNWAQDAHGIITEPPEFAQRLVQDDNPWEGWHHFAQGVKRPIEFYWVVFDEPQIDADGDGPYSGGEIEAEMLELLTP
jgi:hypothetical protein